MFLSDEEKLPFRMLGHAICEICDSKSRSVFTVFRDLTRLPVLYDPIPVAEWRGRNKHPDQAICVVRIDGIGRRIFHIVCQQPEPADITPVGTIIHELCHQLLDHLRKGKYGYGALSKKHRTLLEEQSSYLAFVVLTFSGSALSELTTHLSDAEIIAIGMKILPSQFAAVREVEEEIRLLREWRESICY